MPKNKAQLTTKSNVIHPGVKVRSFERMDDASGAPAVLTFNGFTFAFDMLGEMKLRLIGGEGSRTQSKIARDMCTHAYLTLLETRVEAAWREKNILMYEDLPEPVTPLCGARWGAYSCAEFAGHESKEHRTAAGFTVWTDEGARNNP